MNRTLLIFGSLAMVVLQSTTLLPTFASYNESPGVDYLVAQTVSGNGGKTNNANLKTASSAGSESGANQLAVPNPILATGSDLNSGTLSPNATALAKQLGILDGLQKLPDVRSRAQNGSLADKVELNDVRETISETLRGAEMDVNYVLAEIFDEQGIYNELMSSYSTERDHLLAMTNAVSFGTNGALWAVCEGLAIPTATHSRYAVSSGIIGILAGIIPSIASGITLKEVSGKKHSEPAAPNMLAKIFDRPAAPHNDYPQVVWQWLNSIPADHQTKTRRELIVDRWVADSNIPSFTDRASQAQIDTVTAATAQKKNVTIALLSARLSMLSQLSSEVYKMNRLLNELEMTLRGQKRV